MVASASVALSLGKNICATLTRASPVLALCILWQLKRELLTVGAHALRHGGGGEGVALLWVDKLAHGRQLVHAVHFAQRWGAVTVGRLRLHRGPGNTNMGTVVSMGY